MNAQLPHSERGTFGDRRVQYLDGFRAVAALFVLIHHTYAMAFPMSRGAFPVKFKDWLAWAVYGNLGVSMFIVLAGYSLGIGVARRGGALPNGFWGYMKRRARRIVPPYWAALVITAVLSLTIMGKKTGTHWDTAVPFHWGDFVTSAVLLQDIIPVKHNVAYTFWSISVEFHIYLLLPLMLAVRRRSNWYSAVAVGAAIGITGIVLQDHASWIQPLFPDFYLLFVAGFATCLLVTHANSLMRKIPWGIMTLVMVIVFVRLCQTHPDAWVTRRNMWVSPLAGLIACTLFLALGVGRASFVRRVLSTRALVVIGGFSYSLYLTHAQVLQLVWQYVFQPRNWTPERQLVMGWLLACPIAVIFAWGFSRLFERPFLPGRTQPSNEVASEKQQDRIITLEQQTAKERTEERVRYGDVIGFGSEYCAGRRNNADVHT